VYLAPDVYTLTVSGPDGSDIEAGVRYITVEEHNIYLPLVRD
jgi:hypothetical protein